MQGYWQNMASKMTEVLLVTAILRPVILKLTTKKYLDCHQKYFKLHNNVWHDSRCPYDISSQDTQLVDTVWGTESQILTANHHHGNSKDLLPICSRSDVPKSNTGEAGHCKIQRGDVDWILAWPTFPFPKARCVKAVRCSYWHPQLIEPALSSDRVCILIDNFIVSYAVPNAGQPVCCETKHTHQQDQDCSSVFNVVVQLPSHTTQPKQPDYFKWTEEATDALEGQSTVTIRIWFKATAFITANSKDNGIHNK